MDRRTIDITINNMKDHHHHQEEEEDDDHVMMMMTFKMSKRSNIRV